MPDTAILFGRLLIILGIIGYGYGIYLESTGSGRASWTALIPAIFGLFLMVLGHISKAKENLRKHLMHVAVLIGLIGFIVPLINIFRKIGDFSISFAFVLQLAMSLICLAFVALCVKSFINARKAA